jgi:putative membrane protein
MKIYKDSLTRLIRVVSIGTALSSAIFAVSGLQAQSPAPAAPQAPAAGHSAEISHEAKEFIQFAAQANQTEMAMAGIAQTKSQNSTVKDMAQMMRSDHQQNYAQLQTIAQNHGVALDASLSYMNQRAVNRLQKVSDADFDKEYTTLMIKDHVHAIKRFDKAVAQLEEPTVKEYAESTLPALRKHLHHAEIAARSVGVDEGIISSMLKELPSEEAQGGVSFNQN